MLGAITHDDPVITAMIPNILKEAEANIAEQCDIYGLNGSQDVLFLFQMADGSQKRFRIFEFAKRKKTDQY